MHRKFYCDLFALCGQVCHISIGLKARHDPNHQKVCKPIDILFQATRQDG